MLHLWGIIINIPKPIKSCKSIPRSIDLLIHACRLKTLILNDNKLSCISLHREERGGSKHLDQTEGETVVCMHLSCAVHVHIKMPLYNSMLMLIFCCARFNKHINFFAMVNIV